MVYGKLAFTPTFVVVDATGCWVKGGTPTSAKGEPVRSAGPPPGATAARGAVPREDDARPPSTEGGTGSSATDGTGISNETDSVAARKESRTDGGAAAGRGSGSPGENATIFPGGSTAPMTASADTPPRVPGS